MDIDNWEIDQYKPLINKILTKGQKRPSRAGNTYSIFGETMSIDIEHSFPLLRGRKMFYKPVIGELAAMLKGPHHTNDFKKFKCNYWDLFADKYGYLKLDYGNKWTNFGGINQLEELIDKLNTNPHDRRLIISGWDPETIPDLSLPCCHLLYQWYVRDNQYLDMIWYQRSVDVMVGLPSDIILAAAWNIILAMQCGYTPGVIKLVLGDTHIYANHIEPTINYLNQLDKVKQQDFDHITYNVDKDVTCQGFTPDMLNILNIAYTPQPAIKFTLNV